MRVSRPTYKAPRTVMREETMPDLLPFRSKPTLAPVTTAEISDTDVGLPDNPVARANAEQFVRSALAFRLHQTVKAERMKRTFTPISTRIATFDDDADDETEEVRDVAVILAETVAPRSWADEGH